MEFRTVERPAHAFQQPVTSAQVEAMCRRAFGPRARAVSAVELGLGMYNSTYRVELDEIAPVVLRVAPEPGRQFRIERELMRNEHAAVPYFAPIAPLMPRTLAIDFTHEVVGRDYLFQTLLAGVPAPDGLGAYPREQWPAFFRQMGTIAHDVHAVRGERFGPVAGPLFATWSEAFGHSLEDAAADLDDAGLDSKDVRRLATFAGTHRAVLDEITEPRLLHGDLWTVNVMLDPSAPEPTITGVLDGDRASWGDPEADWTIFMARRKPGTEREAFWDTYGRPPTTPSGTLRALLYEARHVAAVRLERHRLNETAQIPSSYADMHDLLTRLRELT